MELNILKVRSMLKPKKYYAKDTITSHTKPNNIYAVKGEELIIINNSSTPWSVKTLKDNAFFVNPELLEYK